MVKVANYLYPQTNMDVTIRSRCANPPKSHNLSEYYATYNSICALPPHCVLLDIHRKTAKSFRRLQICDDLESPHDQTVRPSPLADMPDTLTSDRLSFS